MVRVGKQYWCIVFGVLPFLWINVNAVQLSIEPKAVEAIRPRDIHISCQPFHLLKKPIQILAIRIGRPDQSLLAAVHNNVNLDKTNEIQVIGRVDGEVDESFLNVTLYHQTSTAAGDYDCEILYLGDKGQIQREKGFASLKEEKTDVKKLGNIVRNLIQKVENLEEEKDLLKHEAKILQEKLKNETKESHDKIIAMTAVIGNQRQQMEVDEDNIMKLKAAINNRDVKTDAQENKLEKILNSHEKLIKDIVSNDKKMDNRVKNLETKDEDHVHKLSKLENTDVEFVRKLNAAKETLNTGMSKLASKQSLNVLNTEMKTQNDKVEKELKTMKTAQQNDKNTMIQSMKKFASKAEMKFLSDKEDTDVIGIKQKFDKKVSQDNSERSKLSSRIQNLENLASKNDKAIGDVRKHMTNDEKSTKENFNALKQSDDSLNKRIKVVSDGAKSRDSKISELSKSLKKQYTDLKIYVNTAISAQHPPSTTHDNKISLHGLFNRG